MNYQDMFLQWRILYWSNQIIWLSLLLLLLLLLSLSVFTKLCRLEMIQGYKYNQGYQWDLQTNLSFWAPPRSVYDQKESINIVCIL